MCLECSLLTSNKKHEASITMKFYFISSEPTERPNSTSSPRKVILTKSGYHSVSAQNPLLIYFVFSGKI